MFYFTSRQPDPLRALPYGSLTLYVRLYQPDSARRAARGVPILFLEFVKIFVFVQLNTVTHKSGSWPCSGALGRSSLIQKPYYALALPVMRKT